MFYQPPYDEIILFETFLNSEFSQAKISNDFKKSSFNLTYLIIITTEVNNFLNLIYQNGKMKPTRFTQKNNNSS